MPVLISEAQYKAGDKIRLEVIYSWMLGVAPRDYTIMVYSKQDLKIKDANGHTNMLHMDGQEPSGFDN